MEFHGLCHPIMPIKSAHELVAPTRNQSIMAAVIFLTAAVALSEAPRWRSVKWTTFLSLELGMSRASCVAQMKLGGFKQSPGGRDFQNFGNLESIKHYAAGMGSPLADRTELWQLGDKVTRLYFCAESDGAGAKDRLCWVEVAAEKHSGWGEGQSKINNIQRGNDPATVRKSMTESGFTLYRDGTVAPIWGMLPAIGFPEHLATAINDLKLSGPYGAQYWGKGDVLVVLHFSGNRSQSLKPSLFWIDFRTGYVPAASRTSNSKEVEILPPP
jgi:hypothetical protein